MSEIKNLTSHLLNQHTFSRKSRDLAGIINQIVLASKMISREINKAGLVDILGETGTTNIQNEKVQKLDIYANKIFKHVLSNTHHVKALGSEEDEKIHIYNRSHHKDAQYIVHIDPLDGSSNIDVNVSVGTNFVIFRKKSKGKITKADYLQSGENTICAGYILYGSSTMLVYSAGKGVHGFTLDPSIGEFILSHPEMKFPKQSSIYSINESYEPKWEQKIKDYIASVKTKKDLSGSAKTSRYIGSLVADFHRNLLKGGIFLYPADKKNPNGKLRLLYEGIPFAYLAREAGGYATTGKKDVLKVKPTGLHQRIPFFVGTKKEAKYLEKIL
jgi:fructose-1,6-bisphosphatase I